MRCVMVMFDSLNRHMLPSYGCDWTHAPNFARLAKKTVTFDKSYVCSMPCMPARRDLHTGRPNFLHRSWGPLEPFDDSVMEMLQKAGVHTHLASDHYHYWEDGGATYHTRYGSWEFFRGQEGDPWKGQACDPSIPECVASEGRTGNKIWRQDWVNRQFMKRECDQPQPKTFDAGVEFIRRNAAQDKWFLQIETFDPHEPFFTQRKYKDLYPHEYEGKHFDWPPYRKVQESREELEHCKYEYAALLSMCDAYMGEVLDLFDELKLWDDTMLIVWTDHGFMLGEHENWAKVWQPFYEEISHTPFFVWDPRSRKRDERRGALVQPAIDLAPTLLEFFEQPVGAHMQGKSLAATVESDANVRDAAMFGLNGGHVNVTDGRYVYMRGCADESNSPLFQYTLMPTHMNCRFDVKPLAEMTAHDGFGFTKGARVMKIPSKRAKNWLSNLDTMLFDLEKDPKQEQPIKDAGAEKKMIEHLMRLMRENEAPAEQYQRLGLV